jgi:hypothetical protein
MSARIRQHIRANVVGYMALFVALSGTAYAVDGPLAGQNQVGSEDIINEEVKREDIGSDAVRTGKVLNDTLLAEDIATGAISSSEVLNSTVSHFDLGTDSVRYPELAPGAFDPAEIAEIAPGFVFGIANDSIQSEEVSANSLNGSDIANDSIQSQEVSANSLDGSDINESTLEPSIDAVYATTGNDVSFGPEITSTDLDNPQNVITDNLPAGKWVVFGEVKIYNEGDVASRVECGIWTDDTLREITSKAIEEEFDDSNYDVPLPLTAAFTTSSPTTLRLACNKSTVLDFEDGILRPLTPDLVAIPVNSLG